MSRRKFSRELLEPETLYLEQSSGQYFYTPDGVGCIWFETREEAMEETGAFGGKIWAIPELGD